MTKQVAMAVSCTAMAVSVLTANAADVTSPVAQKIFEARFVTAASDAATNGWENLAVNSINRLPARTYAMPLASVEAALTDALEPESRPRPDAEGIAGPRTFLEARSVA